MNPTPGRTKMTSEQIDAYIENFYKNKPVRAHYNGPVPVNREMTDKSHMAIKSMFDICQQKFNKLSTKDADLFRDTRMNLFKALGPFKNELNDCVWASKTPKEGEACAEQFILRITTDGFKVAEELSKKF